MQLLRLTLEQFRNYPKLDLQFDVAEPITYIVGQNAQGKTNILEAIYLLALTRSFRTSAQEDLILWQKDFCRVQGEFEGEGAGVDARAGSGETYVKPAIKNGSRAQTTKLEVFFGLPPHQKKSLKKNGVRTSAENFIGNCKAVFFHPEDLNMLYLGPDLRRRYLDVLNLQISKIYYRALRNYKRIVQQRNALLREINQGFAKREDLEVWNAQLVENGSVLIAERARTVSFLNEFLQDYYRKIAESDETISASYKCALGRQPEAASGVQPEAAPMAASHDVRDLCDIENVQKIYGEALAVAEKTDLKAEVTTIGPHRDDIEFLLNGRQLAAHASRGEYRSLLLALKLLELKFFEERCGEKPLLLLDDVFSELDLHRQKMLLEGLQGHQTIITTTHLDDILPARAHSGLGRKLTVADGKLKAL